jgi:TolB-like protein
MLMRLTLLAVLVSGGLAHAQTDAAGKMRTVLETATPLVNRCYDGALKTDPGLEGRLVVALTVGPGGEVKEVSLKEDMLGSTPVASCVLREVKTLQFGKSAAGLSAAFPFMFSNRTRTLAVLPFENLTGDPAQDWMRAAMAESLLVKLGQVKTIVLVDRLRLQEVLKEQALAQSGALDTKNAARAGELAGAQLLVLGNVQKAGEMVRINARVVDSSSSQVKETVDVTGKFADIFTLQDNLAEKLAAAMNVSMDADAKKAMVLRLANTQKELELLGRAATALADRDYAAALRLYRELLVLNPNLPDAHLGVARALMLDPSTNRAEKMPEAQKQMEDALKLRPGDHEVVTYLGFIAYHQNRTNDAMDLQRQALKLKPTHPMGYYGLGVACSGQDGMDQEAIQMLEHAVELDPSNEEFRSQLAQSRSLLLGDHKGALEQSSLALKSTDAGPWNATVHAGIQFRAGDFKGCATTAVDARKRFPEERWGRFKTYMAVVEAACLTKDKRKAEADKVLKTSFTPEERARLKKPISEDTMKNAMLRKEMEGYRAALKL